MIAQHRLLAFATLMATSSLLAGPINSMAQESQQTVTCVPAPAPERDSAALEALRKESEQLFDRLDPERHAKRERRRAELDSQRTELEPSAEAGDIEAISSLCEIYSDRVYRTEQTDAVKWCRRAAELGDAKAQFRLGRHYWSGRGLKRDYCKAVRWYREAAEQGEASAQLSLGNMYRQGVGVRKDLAQALKWFVRAAEREQSTPSGLPSGVRLPSAVSQIYRVGRDALFEEDDYSTALQASRWLADRDRERFPKHAKRFRKIGQYWLGVMYHDGLGVPQDYTAAADWLHKSAEQGYVTAQRLLGKLYREGRGRQQNYGQAAMWLQKAADQNDAGAQRDLGVMYAKGQGLPRIT